MLFKSCNSGKQNNYEIYSKNKFTIFIQISLTKINILIEYNFHINDNILFLNFTKSNELVILKVFFIFQTTDKNNFGFR